MGVYLFKKNGIGGHSSKAKSQHCSVELHRWIYLTPNNTDTGNMLMIVL
jgi:hypothetical protein